MSNICSCPNTVTDLHVHTLYCITKCNRRIVHPIMARQYPKGFSLANALKLVKVDVIGTQHGEGGGPCMSPTFSRNIFPLNLQIETTILKKLRPSLFGKGNIHQYGNCVCTTYIYYPHPQTRTDMNFEDWRSGVFFLFFFVCQVCKVTFTISCAGVDRFV